jgi:plastocyanin
MGLRPALCAGLLQLALLAPLGAVAGPAADAATAATAADTEVKIDNFTFVPQRVTVKPGTTVTWINEDDIPHAIAATGKEFRSKVLDTNDKYSFTFKTMGTFEYFCSLHPHMTGTIVVEATAGGAAP